MGEEIFPKSVGELSSVVPAGATNNAEAALAFFANSLLKAARVCIPAVVEEYDREQHRVKVIPLIKFTYTKGAREYATAQPFYVTVRQICHGGFTLDWPLFVGDTGWVISSDEDGDLCKQQDDDKNKARFEDEELEKVQTEFPQKPNTETVHLFEHGFFIPDCWAKYYSSSTIVEDGENSNSDVYFGTAPFKPDEWEDKKDKAVSISMSNDGFITVTAGKDAKVKVYCKAEEEGENINVKIDGESLKCEAGETSIEMTKDKIDLSSSNSITMNASTAITMTALSIDLLAPATSCSGNLTVAQDVTCQSLTAQSISCGSLDIGGESVEAIAARTCRA